MMTRNQKQCLDFISLHISTFGYGPTHAEIAAAVGRNSKSCAYRLVSSLEERGFITRQPHLARSIKVINRDAVSLSPDLAERLRAYCKAEGEKPEDVLNDLVVLFLDETEGDVMQ